MNSHRKQMFLLLCGETSILLGIFFMLAVPEPNSFFSGDLAIIIVLLVICLPTIIHITIFTLNKQSFLRSEKHSFKGAFFGFPLSIIMIAIVLFMVGGALIYGFQILLNITWVPLFESSENFNATFNFVDDYVSYLGATVFSITYLIYYFSCGFLAFKDLLKEWRDEEDTPVKAVAWDWGRSFVDFLVVVVFGGVILVFLYLNLAHYYPEKMTGRGEILDSFHGFSMLYAATTFLSYQALLLAFSKKRPSS